MGFQDDVLNMIKKIPYGKVTTYKIIGDKMGTSGYRAVGNACKRNPNPIKIPCHRVVNSDGRVGGFKFGTKNKIKLLEKEGIKIKNGKIENLEKILFKF